MLRAIAVFAVALPLLTPTAVGQPDLPSDPPVEQVGVELVTVNGSGCPQGTVASWISTGNAQLMLGHAAFAVGVGTGVGPTAVRKNCQVVLDVRAPAGYTFAVSQVDYTAYLFLPDGAAGQVRNRFYLGSADPGVSPVAYSFAGPVDDFWWHEEPVETRMWAPCGLGQPLTVATELRLVPSVSATGPDAGYISIDYVDAPAWAYHLKWRRC